MYELNMKKLKFKRVLLKLSGESLMGKKGFGIDHRVLEFFANEVKKVHDIGVQLGIVIGGGNIYRGLSASAQGIDRVAGDQMGMLTSARRGSSRCSSTTSGNVWDSGAPRSPARPCDGFFTSTR